IAACHERGLFTALHTGGPGPAAETVAWGVDMVTIAADNHVFKAEMARRAEEIARLTKGREEGVGQAPAAPRRRTRRAAGPSRARRRKPPRTRLRLGASAVSHVRVVPSLGSVERA